MWCPPVRTFSQSSKTKEIATEYGVDYTEIRGIVQRAIKRGLIQICEESVAYSGPVVQGPPPKQFQNVCYFCGRVYNEQKKKNNFACHVCMKRERPCNICGKMFSKSTATTCSKPCQSILMRESRQAYFATKKKK